eukprot:7007297-Prymnesium_polylepis.1
MQRTYSTAGKAAMLTTSATTFVSFMSNASSAFPAVRTFGMFSAALILCNVTAVVTFWPAVCAVHDTYLKESGRDRPSAWRKCLFRSKVVADSKASEGAEESASALGVFFKDVWAPFVIKACWCIITFFLALLVATVAIAISGLKPDTEVPNTLPASNNYNQITSMILDHFVRTSSPTAIELHLVSGLTPSDPIDRDGTDSTNMTDYGTPNYADCGSFNPSTPAAQLWLLNVYHDTFFGNVTAYHGCTNNSMFADGGSAGPTARRVLEAGRVSATNEFYYLAYLAYCR